MSKCVNLAGTPTVGYHNSTPERQTTTRHTTVCSDTGALLSPLSQYRGLERVHRSLWLGEEWRGEERRGMGKDRGSACMYLHAHWTKDLPLTSDSSPTRKNTLVKRGK